MRIIAILLVSIASLLGAKVEPDKIVTAARSQIGRTVSYDAAYRKLPYPGGDVPINTGVCTDVVVRALREQGIDLQKLVHEDMKRNFAAYPKKWGLKAPDANIDHRRVPNLMTFLQRQGAAQAVTNRVEQFRPGDIVSWDLSSGVPHIGIVSDRRSAKGTPLIIHNIGRGTQEEDLLFGFKMTGHYRWK